MHNSGKKRPISKEMPPNVPNILYPKDDGDHDVDRIRGDILPKIGRTYKERLLSAFYTPEQILILNRLTGASIPEYHISLLFSLFGDGYVFENSDAILIRWNRAKALVNEIIHHDTSPSTRWRGAVNSALDVTFNHPWFYRATSQELNKVNSPIMIDLFSRGNVDLLSFKKNLDTHKIHGSVTLKEDEDWCLYPENLLYVDSQNESNQHTQIERNGKLTDVYKLISDALLFVSLLPDNTVNYVLSGVDNIIINANNPLGRKYVDHLNSEIYRTTKEGGIIFGEMYTHKQGLLALGMHSILPPSNEPLASPDTYVYQK